MKVVFNILNNNLKFSQICLSGHANLVQILFCVNILLLQEIYRREHTSDTISKYEILLWERGLFASDCGFPCFNSNTILIFGLSKLQGRI